MAPPTALSPLASFLPRAVEGDAFPSRFDDHLAAGLLAQRIVFLGTQVDEVSAHRVCAQLLLLSAEDPRSDIVLCINSPGGSVTAGLAIHDTMRLIPNDVATLAMGFAASMGQFLLTVGTRGKRFALPNARILIHQPALAGGDYGQASDLEIQANEVLRMRTWLETTLAIHTGRTPEQTAIDIERDKILSAEQAREYGLIDQVLESRKASAQK